MMETGTPHLLDAGEAAFVVECRTAVDPAPSDRVLALDAALAADRLPGIRETVPTHRSLMSQDGGRQGYLRFGITAAGAMDPLMFATANRAVGNPLDATAVEISTGGCPKIATVIGPDLGRLAQLQGGSQIVLGAVSVADAIAARGAEAEALRREIPCEPVVRTEFAPDFLLTLNLVDGVADALVGHH